MCCMSVGGFGVRVRGGIGVGVLRVGLGSIRVGELGACFFGLGILRVRR